MWQYLKIECRGGYRKKKKKTHKPDNYLQTSFIIQEYNDLNKTLLCKHVYTETSEIANSSGITLMIKSCKRIGKSKIDRYTY